MSVASDFALYTNSDGFVSNKPNSSSGNDLLYSSIAVIIRKQLNVWSQDDDEALLNAINKYAQIVPGLYERPNWSQDQEQPDDYYGLSTYNKLLAIAIKEYGDKHCWYFKTSDSAKWYEPMFFRFPAFMCHVKWASGDKPNVLLRLIWILSVAFSGSKSNEDSWVLSWLLINVAGDKGFFEKLATKIYFKRLKKTWGSLKDVFSTYFGDANHPIAKYCPV